MSTKPATNTTTAVATTSTGMTPEEEAALTKRDTPCQFLSLMQGKSGPVEANNGKGNPEGIRAGDYLLGGRTRISDPFDVVPGPSRPSAVYFENNQKSFDTHNQKSPEWAKIAAAKSANDKGAKIGIEVLVWVPAHETHAILSFLNNAREEANPLIACRSAKQLCTISSEKVGKKNAFFVPKCAPSKNKDAVKLPSPEQTAKALAFFEAYKLEKPAPEPAPNARPR